MKTLIFETITGKIITLDLHTMDDEKLINATIEGMFKILSELPEGLWNDAICSLIIQINITREKQLSQLVTEADNRKSMMDNFHKRVTDLWKERA